MELKQIKELMATMGRTGTKKLTLKKEGFELELERDSNEQIFSESAFGSSDLYEGPSYRVQGNQRASAALSKGKDLSASMVPPAEAPATNETATYITSPMVGTFYSAAAPEEPPFVKPGDEVNRNSVVCIVEAMKVMNEVKAGINGTIVEILVENGSPVEFGTKLFRIS